MCRLFQRSRCVSPVSVESRCVACYSVVTLCRLFQRSHSKSMFTLTESDDLTHYGQSLSEIEKFDEPVTSDVDDDEDDDDRRRGKLGGESGAILTVLVCALPRTW